jgi:hypothetical protein
MQKVQSNVLSVGTAVQCIQAVAFIKDLRINAIFVVLKAYSILFIAQQGVQ